MNTVSRRRLLQHAGLWALAWPLLRSRGASAQAALAPRRVVIVFSPNGPIMERGPASGTETSFQLNEFWSPLERHKADGIFFAGMQQAGTPFGKHNEYGHQSGGTGALTARTTEGTNNATGPSIDQFIGQELQKAGIVTPKRSLLWGTHTDSGNWGPWFEAAGKPVGPENDPYRALEDISPGLGTKPGTPSETPRPVRQRLILDAAYRDCRELLGSLGAEGKELLDFHCSNIESLEKSLAQSISTPRPVDCTRPTGPNTTLDAGANFGQPDNYDETMKAFTDLVALAFSCDVTRVIGLSFGSTAARNGIASSYGIPSAQQVDSGDSGPQHHAWTHVYEQSADKRGALRGFYHWYSERVAALLDKLKSTPDADGKPLMDSTLVLWTSELGHNPGNTLEPHPNNHIPVMLFGNSQGAFKTNRFYDGDSGDGTALMLHQLFVSVIQHTGLKNISSFGNQGSGPLDWLHG